MLLLPRTFRHVKHLTVLAALVSACSDTRPPTSVELSTPIDAHMFVAGEAATQLDAQGHFVLPSIAGPSAAMITPARAVALAQAHVATFAKFIRPYLEKQRGASIEFAALRPDPRAYYADTPYETPNTLRLHAGVRKVLGPYYLVAFNDEQGQVLSVGVSAYNTDIAIENGLLALPAEHGNDFRMQAVRTGDLAGMPIAPEHAARIAFEAVGARTVNVPVLTLPTYDLAPQFARWRLQLDRPAAVRSKRTGASHSTTSLYIGLRGEISIETAEQASALNLPNPAGGSDLLIPMKSSAKTSFEPVVPSPEKE
jgi:hypothetical protein